MKIIRITLKEGEGSKVIIFRKEKQSGMPVFASQTGKVSTENRKEELAR